MLVEELIVAERPAVPFSVEVSGTRFSPDLRQDAPGAFLPYTSLVGRVIDDGNALKETAMLDFWEGFSTRLHYGQTPYGTIASAIPSSTLRLPERRSGSLVAVSI